MPRRIIYIKNPTQGSHFRSIGSGSSSAPKSNKPKAPKTSYFDNGVGGQNGYLPGYTTPSSWHPWQATPAAPSAPDYGSYTGPGVGPYNVNYTPAFEEASTLLGALYDISQGIDPYTGNILPPLGTPGTLNFNSAGMSFDFTMEGIDRNAGGPDPLLFGSTKANPNPTIPSIYTGRAPNRNEPRPWWAQ